MKKIISLCLFLSLLFALGVSAYAAGDDQPTSTPAGDGTLIEIWDTTASQKPASLLDRLPTFEPVAVKMERIGDVPYITKTYELAQGDTADTQLLMLELNPSFEQDGYTFTRYDSYSHGQADASEIRTESQSATLAVAENDAALVLAQAAPFVSYDEGGFSGQLKLDEGSITIAEAGRESYGYRVNDVREYGNLDRQDAAYIPKTVTKNGVTLGLENVEWVVMGTTPTGDGLVANLFKAVASYSGGATGSRVSGYTATFRYTGTVEKVVPGSMLLSVVYRGEVIAVPEPEQRIPLLPIIACVLCVVAVLAIAAVAFLTRGKWMKKPARVETGVTKELQVDTIRQAAEDLFDGYSDTPPDKDGYTQQYDDHYSTQEDNEDGEEEQEDSYEDYAGGGYFYGQYPEDEDEE